MGTLQSGVELYDGFTAPLMNIVNALNLTVSAFEDMQRMSGNEIDTASLDGARDAANQATMAIQAMNDALSGLVGGDVPGSTPPASPSPAPVEVPVVWNTDNMPVFTNTGLDRYQQEIQCANSMMDTLNQTQQRINQQAASMDFLPPDGFADLNGMQTRLSAIQSRINQIANNPINMGSDTANAALEQLRGQLSQALDAQQALNSAVNNMDVEAANQAYMRLSRTVGNTERYIRDNVDAHGRFNQEIEKGNDNANQLMNTIRRAVAAYASIQTLTKALDLSDQLTSTTARLNLMNDGLQTTEELQNMIAASAERSRGSYQATADAVSKLGLMAGDAFSSNEEIVAFMEQLNKQFTIAGTEAAGIDAAMLQLTQAMGSGVLRGEEFNSILEQAPNVIQSIADYMGVPKGQLKDLASEGQITAEIVKGALFAAADETNAQFEAMPKTFAQIGQSIQNTALQSFQPFLEQLNEIANSDVFGGVITGVLEGLSVLAGTVLNIFTAFTSWAGFTRIMETLHTGVLVVAGVIQRLAEIAVNAASAIVDNWSWIAPIVYSVAGAYLLYKTYTLLAAAASAIATAAQWAWNAAQAASPVFWIVAGVIALTTAVVAVVRALDVFGSQSTSVFGTLTGCINVAMQFFVNLGKLVANIALGIWEALGACCDNIGTAFHNTIAGVQGWFYNLLSTALEVVEGICAALNKLPFVEFDYSGIAAKADEYAAKSAAAYGSKEEYRSISEAFGKGFGTFDAFSGGWARDAFDAGASWGDGITGKVTDFLDSFRLEEEKEILEPETDYSQYGAGPGAGLAGDVSDIASNTGSIADTLDVTEEELAYLRDIAEQETVNRFTTAEISIDMSGMQNHISNEMDLDGVIDGMIDGVNEAVEIAAEGVHI